MIVNGVVIISGDFFSDFTDTSLPITEPRQMFHGHPDEGMSDISFPEENIFDLLKFIKACKDPGLGNIDPLLFKELASPMAHSLHVIFKQPL